MPRTHYLPDERVHFTWDTGNEPVLEIDSGDTVVVWTRDVSDNQIGPDSDASVIAGLDWDRVYPLAGPIAVSGAAAGRHAGRRDPRHPHAGLGLDGDPARPRPAGRRLPRRVPEDLRHLGRRLRLYRARTSRSRWRPFFGTMGVCPAGASAAAGDAARHLRRQPGHAPARARARRCTCPCRSRARCSRCGDAHGCQGDGEVCVTGLEAPMYAALRFTLEKGRSIPSPQYRTPGPADAARRLRAVLRHHRRSARDLTSRAQDAVRAMVDHVSGTLRPLAARTPTCWPACAST